MFILTENHLNIFLLWVGLIGDILQLILITMLESGKKVVRVDVAMVVIIGRFLY
jgi:hypothetical protein